VEVPVLHRRRKVALLEGRPHHVVLTDGHAAPEDQGLGASADTRVPRANHDVVRTGVGQGDRPDLAHARLTQPEGTGVCHRTSLHQLRGSSNQRPGRAVLDAYTPSHGGVVRSVQSGPLLGIAGVLVLVTTLATTV